MKIGMRAFGGLKRVVDVHNWLGIVDVHGLVECCWHTIV